MNWVVLRKQPGLEGGRKVIRINPWRAQGRQPMERGAPRQVGIKRQRAAMQVNEVVRSRSKIASKFAAGVARPFARGNRNEFIDPFAQRSWPRALGGVWTRQAYSVVRRQTLNEPCHDQADASEITNRLRTNL